MMPDVYSIVQTIRQFGMSRYCGISPERWAYEYMLLQQNAELSIESCFNAFTRHITGEDNA